VLTKTLKLGTRGSQLALWQARAVASALAVAEMPVELVVIKTAGDRLQDVPLDEAGGKRLFVKDLEDALLRGDIDLAVHSAKDLPSDIPEGLTIAATLPREDPRDALVFPSGAAEGGAGFDATVAAIVDGPPRRIGTGSVRRSAQLAPLMRTAAFLPVRGNVDTRLRKLDAGQFDALVLACAGLRRLNLAHRISLALPAERCVPAPGQGTIAIEARAGDAPRLLASVHDAATGAMLEAERALLQALGGDCQVPLGALARVNGAGMELDAIVCSVDGLTAIRRHSRGSAAHAGDLGRRVADELLRAGAGAILDDVRRRAAGRPHTEGT
jgi:hydroxymethylbilane synthase